MFPHTLNTHAADECCFPVCAGCLQPRALVKRQHGVRGGAARLASAEREGGIQERLHGSRCVFMLMAQDNFENSHRLFSRA